MMTLCCKVLNALEGKRLATAESITGGGIGAKLTAVPGSSKVYAGGIISYTDEVKKSLLGVPGELLLQFGAVSAPVAEAMASGVRERLQADLVCPSPAWQAPAGMITATKWARCSSAAAGKAAPSAGNIISPAAGRMCETRPSGRLWSSCWNLQKHKTNAGEEHSPAF